MPPVTPALEPLRRIAAYAVCTDADGRVLLVRASHALRHPRGLVAARRRRRSRRGPQPHGRPRDRRRDRPVRRRHRAARRAGRHAGAAAPRRHHPHRPADLRGDGPRRHAHRPGRPAHRPGPLVHPRRGARSCRCGRSRPPRSACRPASVDLRPDEAPEFPSFYAVPGPGRAAPRAALRRVRGRHRPRTAACCSPGSPPATPAPAAGTCPAAAPTSASSPARR